MIETVLTRSLFVMRNFTFWSSVDASVGTSVETAEAKVGTISVTLSRRPAVGDGSGTLGITQGVDVGALSS